jgi:ADP-ribose pyrophosphatase
VTVVAIDDEDRVLLVRQYRVAVGATLLELPAGTLEVDADGAREDPDLAARRELEEETGMRAGTWQPLTRFFTTPGFTSEDMYLYLATDLVPAHGERLGPDEDERLLLDRVPFADALAAIERGEIVDAKSIVGLFWVERLRRGGADRTDR